MWNTQIAPYVGRECTPAEEALRKHVWRGLDQTAAWQPFVPAQSAQQVETVPLDGEVMLTPLISQCERVLHAVADAAWAAGSSSSSTRRSRIVNLGQLAAAGRGRAVAPAA